MPELRELFNDELEEIRKDSITCDENFEPNDQYIPKNKHPKTGMILPKTKSDWEQATNTLELRSISPKKLLISMRK